MVLENREYDRDFTESILDNYVVKLYARVYRNLNGIYTYIAENLLEPGTALNMADKLEKAIFSLGKCRNAEQFAVWGLCKRRLPSAVR